MVSPQFELPRHLLPEFEKARRLEWITIGYMLTVIVVMYLAMGSSQSMKVALMEDVLSLIPSISFLVASRYLHKKADKKFPYGYHSAFTIAFLCGSVALFAIGLFVVFDSAMTLVQQEHPAIGSVVVGGKAYWLGYAMYGALLYSAVPAMIIGRKKLPLAEKLHNKVLFTDAETQKADWMTALAAMVGITGIGFGWWWADAVAALFISVNILHDGYKNLRNAIADLMSRRPQTTDQKEEDPLLQEIRNTASSFSWVKQVAVRFRENGQIYFGEIFIIPHSDTPEVNSRLPELHDRIMELHWKIHDVTIALVKEFPEDKAA